MSMTSRFSNQGDDKMDGHTVAAIRDAVGERLRRDMGLDEALPNHLQSLLNRLREREEDEA
jgi:hypothetical protein